LVRVLLVLGLLLGGAVFLEPTVYVEKRAMLLRLRTPDELTAAMRAGSRSLGERLIGAARSSKPPAVGARGGRPSESEELTEQDKERLDRLVDRVTREP
jgi:hypothetical protein